jgi:hypothetical protein
MSSLKPRQNTLRRTAAFKSLHNLLRSCCGRILTRMCVTESSEYPVRMRMAVVCVVMVVRVVVGGGVVVVVRLVTVGLVRCTVFLAVRRFGGVRHARSHGD